VKRLKKDNQALQLRDRQVEKKGKKKKKRVFEEGDEGEEVKG